MGKLIDSDELKLRLKNLHLLATSGYGAEEVVGNIVDEMPEGVVRCKDCKHRDPEDKKCDCGHDIQWQLPRDAEWFCADGERRDDG